MVRLTTTAGPSGSHRPPTAASATASGAQAPAYRWGGAGGARRCKEVHGGARRCMEVQGGARRCKEVHGDARSRKEQLTIASGKTDNIA